MKKLKYLILPMMILMSSLVTMNTAHADWSSQSRNTTLTARFKPAGARKVKAKSITLSDIEISDRTVARHVPDWISITDSFSNDWILNVKTTDDNSNIKYSIDLNKTGKLKVTDEFTPVLYGLSGPDEQIFSGDLYVDFAEDISPGTFTTNLQWTITPRFN